MSRYALLLFCLVSLAFADSAQGAPPIADLPPGYVVASRLVLGQARHGFEGAVELLQDGRITASRLEALKQYYWVGGDLADPMTATLMDLAPLAPALLRILDGRGTIRETRTLDSPFGALGVFEPLGHPPGALRLSVWRGGFGSLLVEVTLPFRLDGGSLRAITSTDSDKGETAPLELLRGVKTDWRAVKGPAGEDLLQAICQPGSGAEAGFNEVYIRYRLDKGRWIRRFDQFPGFCDWPEGFPDAKLFP
jgi:hypothetical protein